MINFEIHGDNLTITDAIRNYIEEKIGKLERYFTNVPNATAHVKVKTYQNSSTKIEVTIPLKNVTLRAEERHDDLYAGIDLINNKLERQVRKYKTRVNVKTETVVMKRMYLQKLKRLNQKWNKKQQRLISKSFVLKRSA